jgi:hypothetical protein
MRPSLHGSNPKPLMSALINSGHDVVKLQYLLYPRKRTFLASITMSALGKKPTHAPQCVFSMAITAWLCEVRQQVICL